MFTVLVQIEGSGALLVALLGSFPRLRENNNNMGSRANLLNFRVK